MLKLIVVVATMLYTTPVFGDIWGYCFTCDLPKPSQNWTHEQKLRRGIIDNKKYTTCRLKKRVKSKYTGRQACIYVGGNRTYKLMYEDNCPSSYQCVYDPGGKEPNIDDIIDSLNNATK